MGCRDKVSSNYRSALILNSPNGICDTYGSFTLTTTAQEPVSLTNATFFGVDETGTNLKSNAGHYYSGVWTTQAGAENAPGGYVYHLFLSTIPNPGPNDFLSLSAPLSFDLPTGVTTLYFFADDYDPNGGTSGFGLNLWLSGASAGSPSISGFAVSQNGTLKPDGTSGCSPAFDGTCAPAANTLSSAHGNATVTLTSFSIGGLGGGHPP